MKLNGSEIIVACLKEQEVDTVFGFPGGAVLNIYDALYQHKHAINHILTSHEQGAAHAADGYARSTGKVGVVFATSGPGATNLVTGLATAYMDSIPMVAFTGNVTTELLGKDSFQEVDISGITMPITKHNYIVKDVKDLAQTIRDAFYIAKEGRPGPVLIDVPKDVTAAVTEYTPQEKRVYTANESVNVKDLEKTVKMIKKANKPFIFAGGGINISKAHKEFEEFVEKIDAPVGVSLMGFGSIDSDHPSFTGMIGMHGTRVSNVGVNNCDLMIVIGARFSDRVISKAATFAKKAKIIHIDIDPAEINKNIATTHHVIGDVKVVLAQLNQLIDEKLEHSSWMTQVAKWKTEHPIKITDETKRPSDILKALSQVMPKDAIVSTEVGQHQMWAAQFFRHDPVRKFLTSGGLGTMGYGTGAAIGAQVGNLDKRVVNVAGDGSFRMNCNELATIARYQLPVVILIMNNKTLGMVRQWQTLFYNQRYSQTTLDTPVDWVALAAAFGVKGMHLRLEDDPVAILTAAFALGGPVVIDCEIALDNKVYPMVAPGASIDDMIEESES
ncbi:MAG: biosynthetic-type acetolactate synthase large subunit [Sphaerochaetaceae bacterium]|jgi:acetolactate synthase-1/2/3 large subunit